MLLQAVDLTDPNPISLLLFCTHLYLNLPQYIPKCCVEFLGGLDEKVVKMVSLDMKGIGYALVDMGVQVLMRWVIRRNIALKYS